MNLPSSTKLKRGSITYGLTAIHERPLIPDALSLQAEYPLQILESINAEWPEFAHEAEMCQDVMVAGSADSRKVRIIAKMPRFAFVRGKVNRDNWLSVFVFLFLVLVLRQCSLGDIIPVELTIKHFDQFARQKAIKVELVRIALFGKSKNQQPVQHSLRSLFADIDIRGPANFSFSTSPRLLVPSSTPPTIDLNGKILNVQYQVRININLDPINATSSSKSNNVVLEIPIVVATWPPASVPIDIDLDEASEIEESSDDLKESDDEAEDKSTEPTPHIYVAERPVRTSSLCHTAHHEHPMIPLSTRTPVISTVNANITTNDNSNANVNVNVTASAHVTEAIDLSNNVNFTANDSASTSTSSSTSVVGNIVNAGNTSQYALQEKPQQLHSIHQQSRPIVSRFPMPTPNSSSPSPPISVYQSHSASSTPTSHGHSPSHGYSTLLSHNQSLSQGHSAPISHSHSVSHIHSSSMSHNHSTSQGYTPTISFPQMPITNTFQTNDSHYAPHHPPHILQTLDHAPHYLPTNMSYQHSSHIQQMPKAMPYAHSDQAPTYSQNNSNYSAYSNSSQGSQSESYYPQLESESDPAYAPFAYPMSMPTPRMVMPTSNTPYQNHFSQYPFPPI